jgi:putative flippase GtrA
MSARADNLWHGLCLIVRRQPAGSPLGEFLGYAAASALALAGDFGTLVLLTELAGVHYLVSAAVGFSVGILITYILSVRWVFATRRVGNVWAERAVFLLIGVAGLVINQAVMFGLTEIALFPYAVSKLASVALVFTFNFTARKALLFTQPVASKG